jgi:Family of unknown function (DUF6529)
LTGQSIVASAQASSLEREPEIGFDCRVETAARLPRRTRSPAWIAVVAAVGAIVALTVGLIAKTQRSDSPAGYFDLFFSDPIHLKVWFASAAAALALFQLVTATWIFGKLPFEKPAWVNPAHRWSGRLAFLFTLPVAYHCVFKLGYQDYTDRVMAHSLLGSAFFGAYVTKVSIVRLRRFPRFTLPVAGGFLFAILIAVWYTSALWFFREVDTSL